MSGHHIYSPSRAARIVACPGSVRMEAQFPDEQSDEAAEGKMMHAVMAGEAPPEPLIEEQQRCIEECMEFSEAFIPDGWTILQEQHVTVMDCWFNLLTEGTADVVALSPDGNEAKLIDWKFGRGAVPPPAENYQLALYAAGVSQRFGVGAVEAVIYQPRAWEPVQPYTFTDFGAIIERYRIAIVEAEAGRLILSPSEHGCKYCRARTACPALRLLADPPEKIDELNGLTIVDAYDRAKLAETWAAAVIDKAKALAADGVEGLELRSIPGRRIVPDAAAAYQHCADNISQADFLALVTVPVGKLEDALSKALRAKHDGMKAKDAKAIAGEIIGRFADRAAATTQLERIKGT